MNLIVLLCFHRNLYNDIQVTELYDTSHCVFVTYMQWMLLYAAQSLQTVFEPFCVFVSENEEIMSKIFYMDMEL